MTENSIDSNDCGSVERNQSNKDNSFFDQVFKWCSACKSLDIQGLDKILTDGLLKFIAYAYPNVQGLAEDEKLRRLPIYTEKQ